MQLNRSVLLAAGVIGGAALLITQILPSTPLQVSTLICNLPQHQLNGKQQWVRDVQNLKRSGDLKKGVWILAAGVLTMKCLMAGFRSLVRPVCCRACYPSMLPCV